MPQNRHDHFESCDPRSGKVWFQRDAWSGDSLHAALDCAAAAATQQATRRLDERCQQLLRLADAIDAARPDLALAVTREMGKLPHEADDEIVRSAKWCRFMASHGPAWLADEQNAAGRLRRMPLGVVLAVTPWNYPVWQLLRPLAAALMAGNAVLLKPANNVPQTSAQVETLCHAVLPAGLVQCLWTDAAGTCAALSDAATNMLVCTGSESTGRLLGALAAQHLKPAVLELGGNNAFVVLADADVDAAAKAAAQSRCLNAGQACTAAKRFIVDAAVANQFEAALIQALSAYRCGDTLAPLARADLRGRLADQVAQSLALGAKLRLGGEVSGEAGYDYPATLLTDVRPGMPAFDEELFGPVAALTVARDEADALRLANASRQRLTASVWSANPARAENFARQLGAGMVCFNCRPTSRFELPFAGSGASGYGSVLGRDGLLAFTRPVGWLG